MGGGLMAHASAPGKIILFGEHAVVYGEPSLSLALDRRIHVWGERDAQRHTVNDEALDERHHSYIHAALRLQWRNGPLRLRTESHLPSASGVGSSAALSVATTAVLQKLAGAKSVDPATVARAAFETELETQGAASPNDTTVATAGGAVLLSPERLNEGDFLWRIERGERSWNAHRVALPPLPLVVGNSGSRARTGAQVEKVRRFVDQNRLGRDRIREIGQLTMEAIRALHANDLVKLGQLMNRNHECLHTLGVDTPTLSRLVDVSRRAPGTFGAKLTGAGGGGSMIVLTERPEDARRALEGAGAQAFLVEASPRGLEVDA